jgi:hypothetical protein
LSCHGTAGHNNHNKNKLISFKNDANLKYLRNTVTNPNFIYGEVKSILN